MPTKTDLNGDVKQLQNDLTQLREDFKDLAKSLLDVGRQKVHDARDTVANKAEAGMDRLHGILERVRDGGREAGGRVKEEVGNHPTLSLAAAFGLGFLVGKILD